MRERKNVAAPKEAPARAAATTYAPRTHARRAAPPHRDAIAPFTITPKPDPRGGVPIEAPLRHSEEAHAGADFRPVRVHQDAQASRAAEARNARALTAGEHVYAGRNAPDLQRTREGRAILRHELQHVLEVRRDPSLRDAVLRLPEDQVILQMEGHIAKKDVPAALQVLRGEAGIHKLSAGVRSAIATFLTRGDITLAQAWRAVALQIHGTEATWPRAVRNFVEGIDSGAFVPPAGMPPSTAPELQQVAIQTSTALTLSNTDFDRYRAKFDSMWGLPQFQSRSAEFDPTMDSRGPRNRRARAIFDEILRTDANFRVAYGIAGVTRRDIDAYFGPESMNPEASPRLELLRRAISVKTISAMAITDPNYVKFKNDVTAVAQNLDASDREAIRDGFMWRRQIERVVGSPALREDLRMAILNAFRTKSAAPPPAPVAPAATPPLTLNADQQAFVNNLTLSVPVASIKSQTETQGMTFQPSSSRNPAGLSVSSHVEVTPADVVRDGQITEHPWPAAASAGAAHHADVETEGTGPSTTYTGSLTVVSATGTIPQTPRTAAVTVADDRESFFKNNMHFAMMYSEQNLRFHLDPAASPPPPIAYYGGILTIMIQPVLDANRKNPGLAVFVEATLTRNGALEHTFTRTMFGRYATAQTTGTKNVEESVPPSKTPDAMTCVVEFFRTDTGGTAFHSLRHVFSVHPGTAFSNKNVEAQLKADYKLLNDTSPSGYFAKMRTLSVMGTRLAIATAVADAAQHGNIVIEPTIIRADSAQFLRSKKLPLTQVAYARGHTVVDDKHTSILSPGGDGFRTSDEPRAVFVNLTPSLARPVKRPDKDVISFIIHEGIHALDYPRISDVLIERYKREFRAYWVSGELDLDPGTGRPYTTAYEPSMDEKGPKSKKARAIFNQLYGHSSYPYVKQQFDVNISFRETVNALVIPDGINLIVSRRLDNLRTEIESYKGADFPAHRKKVAALYAATTAPDRQEIIGNPIWREFLQATYKNATEYIDIRTLLLIPQ